MATSKQQLIAEAVVAGEHAVRALAKIAPDLATTIAIGILLAASKRCADRPGIPGTLAILLEMEDDRAA